MKIKDFPKQLRPRERLMTEGALALSDAEILAIILRIGSAKENVLDLAHHLLKQYDLQSLSRLRINTLKKQGGIGEAKACQIVASLELGRRVSQFKVRKKITVDSAKNIAALFLPRLRGLQKEHFMGIYLDARKKILREETIFIGTLNESIIHPREIFKIAIDEGAAAIILIHNHPSGDTQPSDADVVITKELVQVGKIMGIEILDHIIIGGSKYFSFQESGLL